MSVDKIKNRIESFINNDENDLIVIKGEWGIGKTYFWKSLIDEAVKKGTIGKENFAYVSLFGVNDLSDLKNAIITSFEKSENANRKNNFGGLLKKAGSVFKNLEDIPKIGEWANIASYAVFQFLENALICFDDLERKGDNLGFKELFGLATALKESKNCKIVFILNDEFLELNRKEFKTHSEKLIDFEIKFDRSPENAFHCVFSSDFEFYDILKEHCLNLEIRNIRILQRIKRYVESLENTLNESEGETSHEVLHSLVLFCWSIYAKGEKVPSIDFIRKYNDNIFSIMKDEDLTDHEIVWRKKLNEYKFIYLSPLDEVILDYVQKGYFQISDLVELLSSKNFEVKKKSAIKNYEKAWSIYYNSFDNNEDEFITTLLNSYHENINFLSPKQLNSVLDILKDLGHQKKADELIDTYFSIHSKLDNFSLTHSPYQGFITDKNLREKLIQFEKENETPQKIEEIIKRITEYSSYNQEDVIFLANSSVNTYYKFFKSEKSESLVSYIRRLLQFGRNHSSGSNDEKIFGKTVAALKKIAKENKINHQRVKTLYKIEIDD